MWTISWQMFHREIWKYISSQSTRFFYSIKSQKFTKNRFFYIVDDRSKCTGSIYVTLLLFSRPANWLPAEVCWKSNVTVFRRCLSLSSYWFRDRQAGRFMVFHWATNIYKTDNVWLLVFHGSMFKWHDLSRWKNG